MGFYGLVCVVVFVCGYECLCVWGGVCLCVGVGCVFVGVEVCSCEFEGVWLWGVWVCVFVGGGGRFGGVCVCGGVGVCLVAWGRANLRRTLRPPLSDILRATTDSAFLLCGHRRVFARPTRAGPAWSSDFSRGLLPRPRV